MDFGEGDGAWCTASEPHENEANERSIVAAHSGVDFLGETIDYARQGQREAERVSQKSWTG